MLIPIKLALFFSGLALSGIIALAWLTGVYVSWKLALYPLVLAEVFLPPIGALHGLAIWLGFA